MQLNTEKIKKALGWCIQSESCEYCNYNKKQGECLDVCSIRSDALALINSQEQAIERLAKQNERLISDCADISDYVVDKILEARVETVNKMREALISKRIRREEFVFNVIPCDVINEVAKDILENIKTE